MRNTTNCNVCKIFIGQKKKSSHEIHEIKAITGLCNVCGRDGMHHPYCQVCL